MSENVLPNNQVTPTPTFEPVVSSVAAPVGPHKKFPIFSVILLLILSVVSVVCVYLFLQVRELSMSQAAPSPAPSPDASIDPTSNWKEYINTKYKYKIKYPQNIVSRLVCEGEEDNLYFVTPPIEEITEPQNCARDSRFNLEIVVLSAMPTEDDRYFVKESTDKVDFVPATRKTYTQKPNFEGPGGSWYATTEFEKDGTKYQGYVGNKELLETFNQILSTFKFTENSEPTYSLKEISEACIAIHNSSKYWDAKYKECNDGGEDQTPLKTYCLKYGGTFVSDRSTCRHAQEEGLPCGPELSFYCAF